MQKTFSTLQQAVSLGHINGLVIALKASAIAIAVTALYYQDLSMIFNDALQNESTNYVLIIPFLFAYFLCRKRKMLTAVVQLEAENPLRTTSHLAMTSGLLTCLTAVILYWYGSYTFTPLEYHMATLPIFAAGLALTLFNWQTLRQLAFPIAFLFLLAPIPERILYSVGSTLSITSSEISNTILNVLGIASKVSTSYASPAIVMTKPDGSTVASVIDTSCSGIYSLTGFCVFAVFTAYIIRDNAWKKAAIFLVGLPLIYLLNISRITILLLTNYHLGEQAAEQLFHLPSGLILIFAGTALLLVIAKKLFKTQVFAAAIKPCPNCQSAKRQNKVWCPNCGLSLQQIREKLKKTDVAKVAALIISVALLIYIQVPMYALSKGPPEILNQLAKGQEPTTEILPQIENYTLQFMLRDQEAEKTNMEDATLTYAYTPINNSQEKVWALLEIAATQSSFHPWEVCLISWPLQHGNQPEVTQLDLKDTRLNENPPVVARYFAFRWNRYNLTQVMLYWHEILFFNTNTSAEQKHAQITLTIYPSDTQSIQQAEEELFKFGKAVANYWQPIETWTPVVLMISQNGLGLATIPASALSLILITRVMKAKQTKKENQTSYNKLAQEHKKIIDALRETQKRKKPSTLNNVALTYKELYNEEIDKEILLNQLDMASEINLATREIANRQDEPILVWKTKLSIDRRTLLPNPNLHAD